MKSVMPFGKNDHVKIVQSIASWLREAGSLNRYLELGIRSGSCFNCVARFANEAFAVDIDDCHKHIKNNKNLVWFHGTTNDFFKKHNKKKKFDLVFIDACHSHIASLEDFTNVLPLTNDNGLILLHDTYPPSEKFTNNHYCSDTYKTAEVIKRDFSKQCEIVTIPLFYGVSIVRKLDRQLLWKK